MAKFKPGDPKPAKSGRKKGVQNKTTVAVREMLVGALHEAGGQDYLVRQAELQPQAFMGLIRQVIPKEVQAHILGGLKLEIIDLTDTNEEEKE